jgi:hypothetical protein
MMDGGWWMMINEDRTYEAAKFEPAVHEAGSVAARHGFV